MSNLSFQEQILQGIPTELPPRKPYDINVNHAPKRKAILSSEEKKLAIQNALRYFPKDQHKELAEDFAEELRNYGRIYMYRYRPDYKMHARSIQDYPGKSMQAKAIMLMIQSEVERLQIRNGNMTEPETSTSEDNVLNVTFIESDKDGNEIEGGIKKDNSLLIKYFSEKQRKQFIGLKNDDTVVIQLKKAFDDKELDIILNDLALTKDIRCLTEFK